MRHFGTLVTSHAQSRLCHRRHPVRVLAIEAIGGVGAGFVAALVIGGAIGALGGADAD